MPGVFGPMAREVARTEWLDHPEVPPAELAESLAVLARLNRLGTTQALLRHVTPFLAAHRDPRPFRVLDLGTGGADIPAALARWARRRGRSVTVVGLDLQPAVLACARATARGLSEVRLVAGDALRPPVRAGSVDLVLCSLTLHHLPEAAVMALLRLMADLARLGFVVSDLRRSRLAWAAVWATTRLVSRNRLSRHDGPLSVRRAYTRAELAALSRAAGLPQIRWARAPWFRLIGVYVRPGAAIRPASEERERAPRAARA